jgi:hypothetical protein
MGRKAAHASLPTLGDFIIDMAFTVEGLSLRPPVPARAAPCLAPARACAVAVLRTA